MPKKKKESQAAKTSETMLRLAIRAAVAIAEAEAVTTVAIEMVLRLAIRAAFAVAEAEVVTAVVKREAHQRSALLPLCFRAADAESLQLRKGAEI